MRAVQTAVAERNKKFYLKAAVFGAAIGIAILFILLLIFAVLFGAIGVSPKIYNGAATFCIILSCAAGGFISARITKEKGLTVGMVSGTLMFLVVLILNPIIGGSGIGGLLLVRLLVVLISSAVGGVLGVNFKIKRK